MDAHIPERPGPFAGLILVHCGCWSAGEKQAAFVIPLFGPLDRSGLAWFTINYRLTPAFPHPASSQGRCRGHPRREKARSGVPAGPGTNCHYGGVGRRPSGGTGRYGFPTRYGGGDTQNQPLIRLGSVDLPLLFGGGAAADIANGDSVPPHLGFNALGPERPPPRAHESNDFAPGGSALIG